MFTIVNRVASTVGPFGLATQASIANGGNYVVSDTLLNDFLYDPTLEAALQGDQVSITAGSASLLTGLATTYLSWLRATPPAPKDTDGSDIVRPKTTKTGWHFEPRSIKWRCGLVGSLHNKTYAGVDIGDATLSFLDADGALLVKGGLELDAAFQIRVSATAVATYIDWWPTFTLDAISGVIWAKDLTSVSAHVHVIGAPDIPANLGGSVPLNNGGFDVSFFHDAGSGQSSGHFKSDGRGVKTLIYDAIYASNKMRLRVNHAVGYAAGFMITYEAYKA